MMERRLCQPPEAGGKAAEGKDEGGSEVRCAGGKGGWHNRLYIRRPDGFSYFPISIRASVP